MRSRILLAAALLVALAGCGAESSPEGEGSALGFAQFETDAPDVGDAALFEGEVVDRGGCLVVEGEGASYAPIYPAQMAAEAKRLRPGAQVGLGGSAIDAARLGDLPGLVMPEVCEGAPGYWLVVQG